MRASLITVGVVAAAILAGASGPVTPPTEGRHMICLQNGRMLPVSCRVQPGRLSDYQGSCSCGDSANEVVVPVCAAGERQPAESRGLQIARRSAARDGSLVGDRFEGSPMCVTARNRR